MSQVWEAAATCCFLLAAAGGCNQQSVQDAEDSLNEAASNAKDATEGAIRAAGDDADGAMQSAGDAARDLSDKFGERFASAAERASSALEGVQGGGEVLSGMKDLFRSAQETLSGITDKASAEAALAKFDEMGNSVETLGSKLEGMPAEAKTAIAAMVEQGVARLKERIAKIQENPEIQNVVKPKLDALIEKLQSLVE